MSTQFDLVYHCDSRPEIGNGHLKRGLDVLHSIHRRQPGLNLGICGDYSDSAKRFITDFLDPTIAVFHSPTELPTSTVAVLDSMHRPGDPSYLDADITGRIGKSGQRFVIVSSSLRISLPVQCDLFLDHVPDVQIQGQQPREKRVGFQYAPVSAEFFETVTDSSFDRPGHLVAVIGGGPIQDGPERLAAAFYDRALEEFGRFSIVLSPHFPVEHKAKLEQRFPRLEFLQGIPSIAPLLQSAKAIICTYGNIAYESLSCGKPTFLANYVDFQDEYAVYLEQKGLVVNLGLFDHLDNSKSEQVFNTDRRTKLSAQAKELFPRSGIEAITDELLKLLKAG
ncbi:hypothetical protein BMS3Bbin04_00462 [bacterium BMS3Bbin04]|nr:hypothetical protein BMS3Bbin04_00462 [bacterium BMS3Bbin04]